MSEASGAPRGAQSTGPAAGVPALLRIAGADARAFLQGQLSNDLALLDASLVLPAALSTPQGRVVAAPWLFQGDDAIGALVPRSLVKETLDRLRKYVLRAKVALTEAVDVAVVPLTGAAAETLLGGVGLPATARRAGRMHDITVVALGGPIFRAVVIGPAESVARALAQAGVAPAEDNAWRLAHIVAGEPLLYPETAGQFVAQMLNLDLVGAISFSKGCYTGQEIIARTHHLGRIKRRTLRFEAPPGTTLQRMQSLPTGDGRSGKVLDWAVRPDSHVELLAVVNEASSDAAAPAGISLAQLPLPYDFLPDEAAAR